MVRWRTTLAPTEEQSWVEVFYLESIVKSSITLFYVLFFFFPYCIAWRCFNISLYPVLILAFLHGAFFFVPQYVKGQITSWPSWGMWKTISPAFRGCTTTVRWSWVTWRLPTWSTIVISLSWRLVVLANAIFPAKGILLHFLSAMDQLTIKCCGDPKT